MLFGLEYTALVLKMAGPAPFFVALRSCDFRVAIRLVPISTVRPTDVRTPTSTADPAHDLNNRRMDSRVSGASRRVG
ncbi:hypothetical protein B7486_15445 [cyanobacterium TDX16]|nr:hypothetical protein B7486_15445 [cyanobacterium TDX16]